MNIKKLIADIKKDGKIPAEELAGMLAESIDDDYSVEEIYRCIYEKAYGKMLNKSLAECWVKGMDVTDGSDRESGEKWTIEQTTDVGMKAGVDWAKFSKFDWYAALNAAYSDFYKMAKKYGHEDDPMYFAEIVKSFWINDTDVHGKTPFSYYFNYVA